MTAETKPEIKCPECHEVFQTYAGLGSHRRTHGVRGGSTAVLYKRMKKNKKFATKKGKDRPLAIIPTQSKNGHKIIEAQLEHIEDPYREAIDTAVAFGAGRFAQLCQELANQFDVPPKRLAGSLVRFISRPH